MCSVHSKPGIFLLLFDLITTRGRLGPNHYTEESQKNKKIKAEHFFHRDVREEVALSEYTPAVVVIYSWGPGMPHDDSNFNVLVMFSLPGEILNKIHWVLTKEELVPSFSLR